MQASLAVLGFVSAEVAWLSGGDLSCLAGGLSLGFVVPFTLLVIKPINTQLLAPSFGMNPETETIPLAQISSQRGVSLCFVRLLLLANQVLGIS